MLGNPFSDMMFLFLFFLHYVLDQVLDAPQVNFPFVKQDNKDQMALKALKRYHSLKNIYLVLFSFGILPFALIIASSSLMGSPP